MNIISSIILALIIACICTYIIYIYYNKDVEYEKNEANIKNNYQIFLIIFIIMSITLIMIDNNDSNMLNSELELEKALNYIDKGLAPF